MAIFERVPESKAPPPPRSSLPAALQARMREFDSFLADLAPGEVGRLEPERDETTRGVSMRLSRASKRTNQPIEVWAADGIVYFKSMVEAKETKKSFQLGKAPKS